jgi:hypothetical protein
MNDEGNTHSSAPVSVMMTMSIHGGVRRLAGDRQVITEWILIDSRHLHHHHSDNHYQNDHPR